jgi:hypothetical protein
VRSPPFFIVRLNLRSGSNGPASAFAAVFARCASPFATLFTAFSPSFATLLAPFAPPFAAFHARRLGLGVRYREHRDWNSCACGYA